MATWNPVDSDEEFENEEFQSAGKTALAVIISATPDMFESWKTDEESETPFMTAIKCCESLWRTKIVSNSKDLVSIILCGTDKHKNCSDFNHLYVLQNMSTVKVAMIEELNAMKTSDDYNGFEETIGSSSAYNLKDTFWLTKEIFQEAKTDSYSKKILFFTCQDNPHAGQRSLQQDAIEKFNDIGKHVDLNVVTFKKDFVFENFYSRILEESSSIIFFEDDNSLLSVVRMKQKLRRPLVRSTLEIAPGYKVGVGIYSFASKPTPPKCVNINKYTNELVEKSVSKFRTDTGLPALKSEERKVTEIKGEKAVFTNTELHEFKYSYEPGIIVLGFANQSDIDCLEWFKSHSYFLYPDEDRITGSREFFTSLLKRCHALEKIAIVRLVISNGRKPKLACLIPSLSNEQDCKIPFPQGFHLFVLPFCDEIRSINFGEGKPDCPESLVDVMQKVVKKLTNRKFDISCYKSPDVQLKWRQLEKLAIESLDQEDYEDYCEPNLEAMEQRLGTLPTEINGEVDAHDAHYRSLYAASAAKKPKVEFSMEIEAKNKRVDRLTVNVMKEFLLPKGIDCNRKRKAELVEMIYKHFNL